MQKFLTATAIFLVLFIIGCTSNKADVITPQPPSTNCDTSGTIRYSTDVVSLLRTNCYSCHSGNAAAGNSIILDTYTGVKFMADNGRLVRAIAHTGPENTRMPQSGAKMSACNIGIIRTWVRNGSPNN